MNQKLAAKARPLSLQVAVNVTALVFAEPKVGGYSAEVPSLPGCYTQGETLEEVETNLREAIEGWLAAANDQAKGGTAKAKALHEARLWQTDVQNLEGARVATDPHFWKSPHFSPFGIWSANNGAGARQ